MVLQYNKADLPNSRPIQNMRMDLNKYNNKDFKSSVLEGEAVLEPLKRVCKLALLSLKGADF